MGSGRRWYLATGGGDGEGEGEGKGEEEGVQSDGEGSDKEDQEEEEGQSLGLEMFTRHHAIAPVSVPDNFPVVPVLPISRNPLFPRFVKMLEVSLAAYPRERVCTLCVLRQIYNKELIKLIKQKVKLQQPYAGAFLKMDDR